MKYVKFFLEVTAVQVAILAVMAVYYGFAGFPHLNPSSPLYLYLWPITVSAGGGGHGGELFIVPIVALCYSVAATVVYSVVEFARSRFIRKY